jgi:uncharacterized membrane protein YsdA (DUF1294 family)
MRNSILDQQRNIIRYPNTAEGDLEKDQRDYWTLEHGFFAVMGGFVVTVKAEDEWILDDGSTIAPRGVLELARLDKIPNVDKETIVGRSKADLLTKFVVVSQALWMLVQTVGRKASGLPVTLLELNTLAHVGCALLLYLIWWKKPQDVTESTKIHVDALLAAYMSSRELRTKFRPVELASLPKANITIGMQATRRPYPTMTVSTIDNDASEMWNKILPPNKSSRVVEGAAETVPWKNPRELEAAVERCSTHHGLVMLLPGQWLEDIPLTPVSGPQHLTAQDIQRLELWNRVLQCPDFKNRDRETRSFSRDARLTQKASHSRIQGNLQEFSESKTLLIFASLGGIYGAVHATSWTGHFPSVLEKLLWQIAVCAIMGGGVCIYFLNCLLRHWTRTFLWPLGKGTVANIVRGGLGVPYQDDCCHFQCVSRFSGCGSIYKPQESTCRYI